MASNDDPRRVPRRDVLGAAVGGSAAAFRSRWSTRLRASSSPPPSPRESPVVVGKLEEFPVGAQRWSSSTTGRSSSSARRTESSAPSPRSARTSSASSRTRPSASRSSAPAIVASTRIDGSEHRRPSAAAARRALGHDQRGLGHRERCAMSAPEEHSEGLRGWLADRVGWGGIVSHSREHRAPRRSFVFYLGGITLFLLFVQVVTRHPARPLLPPGCRPRARVGRADHRRDPVRQPDPRRSTLGRVTFRRVPARPPVHRRGETELPPPHELTWLSGLGRSFSASGSRSRARSSRGPRAAYTHARVGSQFARSRPALRRPGSARFMRGGDEVTSSTLGHAFGFHVASLPRVPDGPRRRAPLPPLPQAGRAPRRRPSGRDDASVPRVLRPPGRQRRPACS